MTNLESILKNRDITLPTNVCLVKAMFFPVVMYGCEGWTINKAEHHELMLFNCGVGEDESPLDCKQIQPANPKGNQSWIFTERTDAEAEIPILWLPDGKNWLFGKDPDVGKDWRLVGIVSLGAKKKINLVNLKIKLVLPKNSWIRQNTIQCRGRRY